MLLCWHARLCTYCQGSGSGSIVRLHEGWLCCGPRRLLPEVSNFQSKSPNPRFVLLLVACDGCQVCVQANFEVSHAFGRDKRAQHSCAFAQPQTVHHYRGCTCGRIRGIGNYCTTSVCNVDVRHVLLLVGHHRVMARSLQLFNRLWRG